MTYLLSRSRVKNYFCEYLNKFCKSKTKKFKSSIHVSTPGSPYQLMETWAPGVWFSWFNIFWGRSFLFLLLLNNIFWKVKLDWFVGLWSCFKCFLKVSSLLNFLSHKLHFFLFDMYCFFELSLWEESKCIINCSLVVALYSHWLHGKLICVWHNFFCSMRIDCSKKVLQFKNLLKMLLCFCALHFLYNVLICRYGSTPLLLQKWPDFIHTWWKCLAPPFLNIFLAASLRNI